LTIKSGNKKKIQIFQQK